MYKIFRKTDKKGYSLPEVIVAIAILGLLGAMFSQISFSSLKARDVSRERLSALALATSAIDEIKAYRGVKDDGTSEWVSLGHLKANFLAGTGDESEEAGFLGYAGEPNGNVFSKTETDSNGIAYQVSLEIDTNNTPADTFDLLITIESPNIKKWEMQTRIRGK